MRLAGMDSDAEARRCAIACGHAMKAGAACCPMQAAGGNGTTVSPCTPDDSPAAAPVPAGQPAILRAMQPLVAPERGVAAFAFSSVTPLVPDGHPLDHIPLFLS
jgi:hypothetical protein